MENNERKNQSAGNSGSQNNVQGSIGSAGSEGTQAYNNGNEGRNSKGWGEGSQGLEESGNFDRNKSDDKSQQGYEGGQLGTAGSGGMNIPVSQITPGNTEGSSTSSHGNTGGDISKVPVPIVEDNYEGGSLGTAGSGGMDIHGSDSSLSTDALTSENSNTAGSTNTNSGPLNESKNPHGLGAGPAQSIPDGSDGTGAKQPKEHTGKDTEMGGATGGTPGLGNGNDAEGLEGGGVGNKDGSESGSGGGGSSAGSQA